MASIIIAGITIDTEDVDLIVKYCSLAEIDRAIKSDQSILSGMSQDDPLRPWAEHRLHNDLEALEIAEYMWNNGQIVVSERWKREPDYGFIRQRIEELSDYARMLEGNLSSLRETLKEHVNEVKPKRGDGL